MNRSQLYFLLLLLTAAIGKPCGADPVKSAVFLIQNKGGGIIGVSFTPGAKTMEPKIVRPPEETYSLPAIVDLETLDAGGFQLAVNGAVIPIGNVKLPYSFWPLLGESKKFALTPNGGGGWFISKNHMVSRGDRPALIFPTFDEKRTLSGVKYDARGKRLAILFEDGGAVLCSNSDYMLFDRLQLTNDAALDIEFYQDGFYVLTRKSKVYYLTNKEAVLSPDAPDLGEGLACDLELSPFGKGYYILSVFGDIHACGGAPAVETAPLGIDAAIDLEWIPGDKIPRWYPPGWNTEVGFQTPFISLDPEGPPKNISLFIREAENLSWFFAEIRYDPKIVKISLESIRNGSWWQNSADDAQVHASFDTPGSLTLQSSAPFPLYEGPSGGGELLRFSISPAGNISPSTASLELANFFFRAASPGNPVQQPAKIAAPSCLIRLAPVQPKLNLVWIADGMEKNPAQYAVKPGDAIRVDIAVEDGGRLCNVLFDFHFSKEILAFLGMTIGGAWSREISVIPQFGLPFQANAEGGLMRQKISAALPGACMDEKDALVSLFFVAQKYGEAKVQLTSMEAQGHRGENLELIIVNRELPFSCR
ncbi:MAG: hypothetical protein AB1656_21780 [Candidatus Omnitrophota bacterium]